MNKWHSIKKPPLVSGHYLVLTHLGSPFHIATFNVLDGTFAPWYEILKWTNEDEQLERHISHNQSKKAKGFNNRITYWVTIPEHTYAMRNPKNESV